MTNVKRKKVSGVTLASLQDVAAKLADVVRFAEANPGVFSKTGADRMKNALSVAYRAMGELKS